MLTVYGKREWMIILIVGAVLTAACVAAGWWWLGVLAAIAAGLILTFFRDPPRRVPTGRGSVVSPADGRVSSVHRVEHFEPFDGPATCIRIFLSVLNVHVNRIPCHGRVSAITHKPGLKLNALNPRSAEVNESTLIVLEHPTHGYRVGAVRQVAGLIARTIVCGLREGEIVQRGRRFGMIKFGSTTELYLPDSHNPQVQVRQGQRVYGASTVLAKVTPPQNAARPVAEDTGSSAATVEASAATA